MTLGTNYLDNTSSSVQEFIPELWSDDIIATYMANLVVAKRVTRMNHVGKRGDTIHVPAPTRGSASATSNGAEVTLVQNNSSEVNIVLDKWYHYAIQVPDIINVQSLPSLRQFYTQDAGYALAKQTDTDLHLLGAGFQGGSIAGATNLYEKGVIGGDGSTNFAGSTANGTAITDPGLRNAIQLLDDNDVPFDNRSLIIPPVSKNNMTGIGRFTEQAFTGETGMGNTIRNGRLGDVYGIEVFVSSNCPWIHVNSVTNTQSVTSSSTQPTGSAYSDLFGKTVDWDTTTPSDTKFRAAMLLHKEALVHAEQQTVRSQTDYLLQRLSNLFVADCIYGVKEMRDTSGVAIIVPA